MQVLSKRGQTAKQFGRAMKMSGRLFSSAARATASDSRRGDSVRSEANKRPPLKLPRRPSRVKAADNVATSMRSDARSHSDPRLSLSEAHGSADGSGRSAGPLSARARSPGGSTAGPHDFAEAAAGLRQRATSAPQDGSGGGGAAGGGGGSFSGGSGPSSHRQSLSRSSAGTVGASGHRSSVSERLSLARRPSRDPSAGGGAGREMSGREGATSTRRAQTLYKSASHQVRGRAHHCMLIWRLSLHADQAPIMAR